MARVASSRVPTASFRPACCSALGELSRGLRLGVILQTDGAIDWTAATRAVRAAHRLLETGDVAGLQLRLASVHDHSGLQALERIPDSFGGLGRPRCGVRARRGGSSCRSHLPGIVAGSIFTFSLTLGDYITPSWSAARTRLHRQRRSTQRRLAGNLPFAAALAMVPIVIMIVYLRRARLGAFEALVMETAGEGAWLLRLWVALVLLFLFVPIAIVLLYAFNVQHPELADRRPVHEMVLESPGMTRRSAPAGGFR